jgi:hypothetical protein
MEKQNFLAESGRIFFDFRQHSLKRFTRVTRVKQQAFLTREFCVKL